MRRIPGMFLFLCLILSLVAAYFFTSPKDHIFLLPDGYIGWVEVTHDQVEYPPLMTEGKHLVYAIPPTGIFKTSSPSSSGILKVYYVDEMGKRTRIGEHEEMIHGVSISPHGSSKAEGEVENAPVIGRFFVGKKEQISEN